jgi:predicted CoA-binding protein
VTPTADPSYDILCSERQPLEAIFAPRTDAVVGASEDVGSVGRTLLWNLCSNPFGGGVYPVNPSRTSVLEIKAYPNVGLCQSRWISRSSPRLRAPCQT